MLQVKLTISELAWVTGVHRQTVSKRLKNLKPLPGSNSKRKIYDLRSALPLISIKAT